MTSAAARSHFTIALGDLGCALAVFACGLFGATALLTGLASLGMAAYWSASRRRVLKRLPPKARASQTGLALSVITAIAAGAYWLGLGLAGSI